METYTDTIPISNPNPNPKKTRCPTGTRKDPKTGLCIPMTEEMKQHKKTMRNKAKSLKTSLKKNSREETVSIESIIPVIEPIEQPTAEEMSLAQPIEIGTVRPTEEPIVKRCPAGTRKDPKTKKCIPMTEEMKQHKKTLRNRKKNIIDKESTIEPPTEPVAEQVIESPVEPLAEPVVESLAEPVIESPAEPVVESPAEPVAEPVIESLAEPAVEPLVEIPMEVVEEEQEPKLTKRQNKQNEFLLKKEKLEHDALLTAAPETDTYLYPTLDDPDFNYKISQRQEFEIGRAHV